MATLPDVFSLPLAAVPCAAAEPRAEADAAAERDRVRLSALYREHAPRVHRFLRDLLRDEALAADATQETFARLLRQMPELRDDERLAPWLFGVARHVSLELRRARARAGQAAVSIAGWPDAAAARGAVPGGTTVTPEAAALGREALRVVDEALARLPEDRRAALVLRLDHGLAYEEIARVMQWSLAKAKVEIFRAREVLRATYAEYAR